MLNGEKFNETQINMLEAFLSYSSKSHKIETTV